METFNEWAELFEAVGNTDIEGFSRNSEGRWVLDRRLNFEAIGRLGLTPRTADLGLIGPEYILVPDALVAELGLPRP